MPEKLVASEERTWGPQWIVDSLLHSKPFCLLAICTVCIQFLNREVCSEWVWVLALVQGNSHN